MRSLATQCLLGLSMLFLAHVLSAAEQPAGTPAPPTIVDLSLTVTPEFPCAWPVGMTQYSLTPYRMIGPGAYNRDMVMIDEHTGTQFNAPAHFVPPPDSGLPGTDRWARSRATGCRSGGLWAKPA